MTPKSYTELDIDADEDLRDHLVGILSQIGFEGFWEDGSVLRCYINRERWSDAMRDEVEHIVGTVQRAGTSPAPAISVRILHDKNWNEEWEKTIQPIHVTRTIVITPTWQEYRAKPGEIVLTIDPKMSFGTGYHETTRLVLTLMEHYCRPGMSLLDIGTGTGVLAIAGIKLGAASAVGVDNDEWSYENALENIRLNGTERDARIILGELSSVPPGMFDLIVANIQRNVIEPLLPDMKSRIRPRGTILLSGLLDIDEDPIRTALDAAGLRVIETLRENEWIALATAPHT